jgi:hypothetical protein
MVAATMAVAMVVAIVAAAKMAAVINTDFQRRSIYYDK